MNIIDYRRLVQLLVKKHYKEDKFLLTVEGIQIPIDIITELLNEKISRA